MKKYSFRLQTILEIRKKTLEEKRKEMAKVISLLNEQDIQLKKLCSKQQNVKRMLENIYNGGKELDILEITNYKDYLGKVIVDTKTHEQIIEKTKIALRIKQMEVTNALKEVKILDKLRETQEKKFYQEYLHLEAKEIDDIVSTRYRRISA